MSIIPKDHTFVGVRCSFCHAPLGTLGPCPGPQPLPQPTTRPSLPAVTTTTAPPITTQVWNVTTALASFVGDGFKTVTTEQYQARLDICDGCEFRTGNRCNACGCYLSLKAKGRAFQCPKNKWPAIHETASLTRPATREGELERASKGWEP
jgi:hypothetical protein